MANPFAAFQVSDDEEDNKVNVVKTEDKPRRTHQDKKNHKKQQEEQKEKLIQAATSAPPVVEEVKEQRNPRQYEHRDKKNYVQKELTEGHTSDRRSGTGREDRPRKAGGGYGNVGNIKDVVNQDKYVKENEENKKEGTETDVETVPPVEVKPPSPPKLTLDEYYKSKGVDLTYTAQTKAPVKKGEINAEWIKKEKLTLLESKEEKKQQERSGEQVIKHTAVKGLDVAEETLNLGFGSKPTHSSKQDDHRDKRDHRGGKNAKPLFSAQDFPAL